MRIDRNEDYSPDSIGAEIQRICDEVDAACPGFGAGDVLLADFNAKWVPMAEAGLRRAWKATE